MARYNTTNPASTTTTTTTFATPAQGTLISLTGTAPYTVNLASPLLYVGVPQSFYNESSGTITLSTSSGNIIGPGFSNAATQTIPRFATYTLMSDGSDYIITNNEGGPQVSTTHTFSGTATFSGAISATPANANITLSPTGTGTVTISPASTVSISPTGALTLNPTAAGTINNMSIGATTRSTGAFTTLTANNTVTFTSTTGSTSVNSGALQVDGGVGVNGNIYCGGTLYNDTTGATRIGTGTTAQRPTGANGLIRYNTTTSLAEYAEGTTWRSIAKGFVHTDVTSNITAAVWNTYWVDTASGPRTITLPNSGLVKGDTIRFFDLRKTFDSSALTIARNGQVIQGDAADLTVNTEGAAFELVYHGSTYGWRIFSI